MVVWWTIPNSSIAWEWRPEDSIYVPGVLVRDDDGSCSFTPGAAAPHPWPEPRRPAGQALAEMTATFAMEANIRPTDMTITWIRGIAAVSWDRCLDRWLRHEAGARSNRRCLHHGTYLRRVPVSHSVEEAGAIALDLLDDDRGRRYT
ncbi:MAG: hypothetical protein GEV03_03815 [Streptosporangiales bacterium]|nr:hypothetical protein [Streptosporangiales bacterium]